MIAYGYVMDASGRLHDLGGVVCGVTEYPSQIGRMVRSHLWRGKAKLKPTPTRKIVHATRTPDLVANLRGQEYMSTAEGVVRDYGRVAVWLAKGMI